MRRTVLVLGLAAILAGWILDRTGAWGWAPELTDAPALVVALLVLAAAGLVGFAEGRWALLAAAVLAVAAFVGAAVVLVGAVVAGLPGPSTGVLGAGAALVAVGAIAGVVPRAVVARGRVLRGAGVVLTVIVAAGVVAGAGLGVDELPVRTTSTGVLDTPEAPVLRPGAPRWRWESPTRIADVAPVAEGVAVLRRDAASGGDEVVGLDGASGQARWSFRRGGAAITSITPTADGRSIVVLTEVGSEQEQVLITVLDAGTGARRWQATAPGWRQASTIPLVVGLTDHVLAITERDPEPWGGLGSSSGSGDDTPTQRLVARSLDTGSVVWEWRQPPGCRDVGRTIAQSTVRTHAVVVTSRFCADGGLTVVGLDDRTGTPSWELPPVRYTDDEGRRIAELDLSSAPDGDAVLQASGTDSVVADAATGRVLGRPPLDRYELAILRPGPTRPQRVGVRPGGHDSVPLSTVDPATGATVALPPETGAAPCATDEGAVAVTAVSTLRLCGTGPGFGLRTDEGPVVPVDVGTPVLRPIDPLDTGLLSQPSPYVLVPAPGALVVGSTFTEPAALVGFGPAREGT